MDNFTIIDKCITLCAKRNSGKSQLVYYLVNTYKSHFSKIFLINPTERLNKMYETLIPEENTFNEYDDEWIGSLIKKMSDFKAKQAKGEEPKRVLLILDDVMSDENFQKMKHFRILYTRGRHFHVSIITIQQYLYQLPKLCRCNTDFLLCSQSNAASLQLLADEFTMGSLTKQEFKQLFHKSTNDYNFLVVNCSNVKDNKSINSIYGKIRTPDEYINK